jgi:uncharacterized protein
LVPEGHRVARAEFRFYEELNDFLPPERRKQAFWHACARAATVKNAIEAIGVPHTEVELILVNGESVDFSQIVREGDRVAVFPCFETFDVRPLLRVREAPLREPRFIADAHLGALARMLRMLGYDTVYSNQLQDDEIVAMAAREGRIILTRDREMLKRREVTHGCFVHAIKPETQFEEIVERLQLAAGARPFSLCLHCNLPLKPVEKSVVLDLLPPRIAEFYERFCRCEGCARVYWEGSHWDRMRGWLTSAVPGLDRSSA